MRLGLQRVSEVSLSEISAGASVLDCAEMLARVYDFAKHPFFIWARAPGTRLEEFRACQTPYLHYVEHFSRALTAVLARVPSVEQRLQTVYDNVAEEHGRGRIDSSHRDTFAGYLRAIGVDEEAIRKECPFRFLVAYQSLLDFCLVHPPEMGAAATGIVEYTHVKIAALLAQIIHERFWGDLETQRHYRLHVDLDVDHALALFALCEEGWKSPLTRERIAFAMAFSLQVWWSTFDAMCPADIITPSPTDVIRAAMKDPEKKADLAPPHADRTPCNLRLRTRLEGGSWMTGQATSIGDGGLVMRVPNSPVRDAGIEVELDGVDRPSLTIFGRVRSRPNASGDFCVEFLFEDESRRAEVRTFVKYCKATSNDQTTTPGL